MPSPIVKLVAQRIALGLLLLFAVSVLIFVGLNLLPGDVAQSILGQLAAPMALENLRQEMRLAIRPMSGISAGFSAFFRATWEWH